MQYLGLGVEIAVALAIPILAGYYADVYFQTSPIGILAGIALGLVLLFLTFLRIYKNMIKKD
jgi:F0F1-type ATP synthase assembly protein I